MQGNREQTFSYLVLPKRQKSQVTPAAESLKSKLAKNQDEHSPAFAYSVLAAVLTL